MTDEELRLLQTESPDKLSVMRRIVNAFANPNVMQGGRGNVGEFVRGFTTPGANELENQRRLARYGQGLQAGEDRIKSNTIADTQLARMKMMTNPVMFRGAGGFQGAASNPTEAALFSGLADTQNKEEAQRAATAGQYIRNSSELGQEGRAAMLHQEAQDFKLPFQGQQVPLGLSHLTAPTQTLQAHQQTSLATALSNMAMFGQHTPEEYKRLVEAFHGNTSGYTNPATPTREAAIQKKIDEGLGKPAQSGNRLSIMDIGKRLGSDIGQAERGNLGAAYQGISRGVKAPNVGQLDPIGQQMWEDWKAKNPTATLDQARKIYESLIAR